MRRLVVLLIVGSLAAPAAARTLAPGSHGAAVKTLQTLLVHHGFTVTVDGRYGPGTRKAVRAFQRGVRLRVTGIADPATMRALRQADSGGAQAPDGSPGTTTTPPPTTTATPPAAPPATASSTPPAGQATLDADNNAVAPIGAPQVVIDAIAGANRIDTLPYVYGGGHKSFDDTAYDCSGSVSYVLHAAGLLDQTMTSGQLAGWGDPGPGQWITVYANAGHTWVVVAGLRFDTARYDSGTTAKESGPRWRQGPRPTDGFVVRHPTGL